MGLRPAAAGRPRFDIGDIVRQHRAALESQVHLTPQQRRVLSAIALCRTVALGGHVDVCRSCGHEHPAYNSCRNRHCPKCQALAQEKWISARSKRLLPVKHFHAVFTLPRELRVLARLRGRAIYNALMAVASATLLELGQSRLHARLGVTMVLHTWTRDLRFHPHVHAIVTAGGLNDARREWIASPPNYLFPVKVMGELLRGKMIAALRALNRAGILAPTTCAEFERLIAKIAALGWNVYVKKAFRRVDHVMAYLGRYTHRVAIANSRIVAVSDRAITFRTKQGKCATLTPIEFLRRFVQHVLPDGFHKIRHYGLYCSALARPGAQLDDARHLLQPAAPKSTADPTSLSCSELLQQTTGRDVTRCSRCGGPLRRVWVPSSCVLIPSSRGPPPLWSATP